MSLGENIRRRRVLLGYSQEYVGNELGISGQAVQLWESDETQPRRKRMQQLARVLQCTVENLEYDVATREPPAKHYNVEAMSVPAQGPVPLISWVAAGDFCDTQDPYALGEAEDWYQCPVRHGDRTFCLRVRGLSMYNPGSKPSYEEGDIIYVDPDVMPANGQCVIVRIEGEQQSTFKQYIEEGNHRYLRALNPGWHEKIIKVDKQTTICGTVIGKFVE